MKKFSIILMAMLALVLTACQDKDIDRDAMALAAPDASQITGSLSGDDYTWTWPAQNGQMQVTIYRNGTLSAIETVSGNSFTQKDVPTNVLFEYVFGMDSDVRCLSTCSTKWLMDKDFSIRLTPAFSFGTGSSQKECAHACRHATGNSDNIAPQCFNGIVDAEACGNRTSRTLNINCYIIFRVSCKASKSRIHYRSYIPVNFACQRNSAVSEVDIQWCQHHVLTVEINSFLHNIVHTFFPPLFLFTPIKRQDSCSVI